MQREPIVAKSVSKICASIFKATNVSIRTHEIHSAPYAILSCQGIRAMPQTHDCKLLYIQIATSSVNQLRLKPGKGHIDTHCVIVYHRLSKSPSIPLSFAVALPSVESVRKILSSGDIAIGHSCLSLRRRWARRPFILRIRMNLSWQEQAIQIERHSLPIGLDRSKEAPRPVEQATHQR